jgi:hypothetical protein
VKEATEAMSRSAATVITDVDFTSAPPEEGRTGLLGYVAATINGRLRIDGITLRRTADGRLAIAFPARRDAAGRQHPYVRPVDDAARREIELQIFAALGLQEHAIP